MTRVVIDPGVLVSAFISPRKAAPALIIDAVRDGKLDLIVSPLLISELTDVLMPREVRRTRCGGPRRGVHRVLLDRAEMVADAPGSVQTGDPDDDYLLALAEAHDVDAVVSGDPHLHGAASSRLHVLTPRELVDRLSLELAD